MQRDDVRLLHDVFGRLSAASRSLRYLVPTQRLTASMETALMDLEAGRHVAWVAMVAGQPVGIGRYVRSSPGRAELAVEVIDSVQHRGIGSALADAVICSATRDGIETLEVTVRPDNVVVLHALRRRGVRLVPQRDTITGDLALTG